jgi:hypothetical protein
MRLFRQHRDAGWETVMVEVVQELHSLMKGKEGS